MTTRGSAAESLPGDIGRHRQDETGEEAPRQERPGGQPSRALQAGPTSNGAATMNSPATGQSTSPETA